MWLDGYPGSLDPRPPLPGALHADVAIVGAGFTGLWTAYYLLEANPSLNVVLLESEIAGFGASGRNGGWCSAFFSAGRKKITRRSSFERAVAMQRAMFATVDEVGRVAEEEGIEARYTKGGALTFATADAHIGRLLSEVEEEHASGFGEGDYRWLDEKEACARVRVNGARGALYSPHCAVLDPARLARGLAETVEGKGARLFEQTTVEQIDAKSLVTPHGIVTADVVVRATEGYTPRLPGLKRALVPIYSLMVATEPLPESFWNEVGWGGREALTDGRHLIIYAQRTADDRIALGGRGAPYHFGSRITDGYDREPRVFAELEQVLTKLFPAAREARITHRWGGCLGVPRDWMSSVGYDPQRGHAWAGGYVGDGVSTTNLAGRTLADLLTGADTELTRLPWVGHRSRRWAPEPLRWMGINLGLRLGHSADVAEAHTGRPSRRGALVERLTSG